MPSSMTWIDSRLGGAAPSIAPNTYTVNATTQIRHALGWVSTYARRSGGLTCLNVMCHGIAGGVHDQIEQVCAMDLGFGLQLCAENLTRSNVNLAGVLRNLVCEIFIYACGAARTRRSSAGTVADGRRFCSELAAITNAAVIAADTFQVFTTSGSASRIDFGDWEGNVYRFMPDGSARLVCSGRTPEAELRRLGSDPNRVMPFHI